MPMTPEQALALNEAALCHPYSPPAQPGDGADLPCIDIGGVQVYVYADPERGLRISVHCDTAEEPLLANDRMVPLEVELTGESPVYRVDEYGVETYPQLSEQAHAAVKAVCDLGDALGVVL